MKRDVRPWSTEATIALFSFTEQLSHTALEATQPSVWEKKKKKGFRLASFGASLPCTKSLDLISEPLWMWRRKSKTEARVILARNPFATIARHSERMKTI